MNKFRLEISFFFFFIKYKVVTTTLKNLIVNSGNIYYHNKISFL